jgi:hypothetical protein
MKPRIFTSILLFISAYSPLFLILAVKDFDFQTTHQLKHPLAIYILLGLTLLSVILLFVTVSTIKRGNMCVEIVSVKNRSVDLINYTIPYMLSFFGIDLSKPEDVIAITIFMLIMLLLTITSKSVFLNPVLALVGYGLYDFDGKTCSTIVISKLEMHTGDRFYIRSLTRFLYFVTEEKNKNTDAVEN